MNEQEKPDIVVDDDWKTQVENEKEALRQKAAEEATDSADSGEQDLPKASMPVLVTTLATQALAALGQIPDPVENKPVVRRPIARHFIDTLAMLEDKTKGNLTEDEAALLGETLHQLRMIFVQTGQSAPASSADDSKPQSSTIELP